MCVFDRPRRPNEAVPLVNLKPTLCQLENLSFWRRRNEDNVVSSNYDCADVARVVWVGHVLRVFKDQVHVLIVTVEFAANRAAAL